MYILQRSLREIVKELKKAIKNKSFVIGMGILLCVLLIQMTKMTRYGEPYKNVGKEGFSIDNDEAEEDTEIDELTGEEVRVMTDQDLEKLEARIEEVDDKLLQRDERLTEQMDFELEKIENNPKMESVLELVDKHKQLKYKAQKVSELRKLNERLNSVNPKLDRIVEDIMLIENRTRNTNDRVKMSAINEMRGVSEETNSSENTLGLL